MTTRTRILWTVLVALLVVHCGPGPVEAPEDVEVAEARLDNVHIGEAGVAMGYVWGKADLRVVSTDGQQFSWPVQFDGPIMGIVGGGATTGSNLQTEFKFPDEADPIGDEIPDVDGEEVEPVEVVTANDLLGTYTGIGIGLAILYGGHARHLKNDAGVVIAPSFFMRGLGILWFYDSLTVSLAE